jgi:predicted nucleic acid-binding protein
MSRFIYLAAAWPRHFQQESTRSPSSQKWRLAWPSLTAQEEQRVREFLQQLTVCELTASIRARAVALRKRHNVKLRDAVVCATAMELNVELWTNDKTLARVPGLKCRAADLIRPE